MPGVRHSNSSRRRPRAERVSQPSSSFSFGPSRISEALTDGSSCAMSASSPWSVRAPPADLQPRARVHDGRSVDDDAAGRAIVVDDRVTVRTVARLSSMNELHEQADWPDWAESSDFHRRRHHRGDADQQRHRCERAASKSVGGYTRFACDLGSLDLGARLLEPAWACAERKRSTLGERNVKAPIRHRKHDGLHVGVFHLARKRP